MLLFAAIRPWIRPAIVGIIAAGEPDLIAVIDGWSTGDRKLDQGRKLNATLTLGEIGDIKFLVRSGIGPRREDPQQPSGVMAVEQVHHRVVGRVGIVFPYRLQSCREFRRHKYVSAVRKTLVINHLRSQEPDHRIAKTIVHGGVGTIAT